MLAKYNGQRPPHAEHKLVSCLQGEVWDVAVDLRQAAEPKAQAVSITEQQQVVK